MLASVWCLLASVVPLLAQSTLNDGIPESWRIQYFGTNFVRNPLALALGDADGDGVNNFQEYQAGTDPLDASSKPSVPVSVSTYAGTGAAGGQDGYRTNATFNNPGGLVLGLGGNLYVTESTMDGSGNDTVGAHRIRRIDTNGMVTTYVGGDTPGSVDGTVAVARFKYPVDVVFDRAGNAFVAEGHGHRIRKVGTDGMVAMFAGSPGAVAGSANGTGTNAQFNTPWGLVIDPGDNLYVADLGNNRIRKVTPAGVVTTYASGFSTPTDIARSSDGTLYVADWGTASIKKVDTNGVVSVFKSGLSYVERAVPDAAGNVYAALGNTGTGPRRLYKYSASGAQQWVISTAYGYQDGPIATAQFTHFSRPVIAENGDFLSVEDSVNRVRQVTTAVPAAVAISPGGGTFTNGVTVTAATTLTNVVLRYTLDGSMPTAGSAAYGSGLALESSATVQVRAFVNTNPVSGTVSAVFTVTAPTCVSAPAGLVAWWNGEGNANDVAGGYNGQAFGDVAYTGGKVGQAFQFNGSNSYLQVASSAALKFTNAFSVEAWINYGRLPGNSGVSIAVKGVDAEAPLDWAFNIYYDGKLRPHLTVGGSWVAFNCATTLATNTWHHVAMVYDGSALRGYVNGVLDGSASVSGTVQTSDNPVRIGAYAPVNGTLSKNFFSGTVDELSLYNRALSASEVAAIYSARGAGKCAILAAPTLVSQPQGQTVVAGNSASFSVSVVGTHPFSYQWRFNGVDLPGATNASLALSNVQPANAGNYTVTVGNSYGATTSSNAFLAVITLGANLFDDFDPGIDSPQWSAFGGTVLATNYGGKVSGDNSLWLGGTGFRFATTRALNTSGGGTVGYYLRLAAGTSSTWETADLPGEGVVLEYSVDSGTQWTVVVTNNTTNFTAWTQQQFSIPSGAQSASTLFRWRQLANSGASYDHWALDDVSIQTYTNLVAPVILSGPASRSVIAGEGANFSVPVSGTAPFSYQWRFNGANISGATNSTLALVGVQAAQAGNYSVAVGNVAGTAISPNAVLTVTVPVCVPAPAGLVAWWNGEGNANDVSGGYNGQPFGSVNYTPGQAGQAFLFNGSSSYVQVPSSAALKFAGAFSIEAWVHYDRVPSNACAIAVKGPDGELPLDWDFEIHSLRKLRANVNVNGNWVTLTCATTLATNTWHHVAMVYDGSALRCYLDGVQDGYTSLSGAVQTSDYPVRIGAYAPVNANGSWNFFSGAIDELSLYNRALSASEVMAIYGARGAGKCGVTPTLAITGQPQDQAVTVGGSASFSVGAVGTPPIGYQWRFNATNISGATNATLALANVQFAQAGDYSVVAGNAAGTLTSSNAALTVSAAAVRSGLINLNNYDANNNLGAPIYLLNTSTLAPLDTRVQVLGGPLGGPLTPIISEATHTNVFLLSDGADPGYFDAWYGYVGVPDDSPAMIQVLAWRGAASYAAATVRGSAIFTNMTGHGSSGTPPSPPMPAVLQVPTIVMQSTATAAPAITVQPQGRAVIGGSSVTLGIVATGSPAVGYQWHFNSADIPGATNANFTIPNAQAANAGSYTVFISNSAGSVVSDAAVLTVRYLLSVTSGAGGAVAKNPASSNYAPGTVVELAATPNAGFAFTGWGGDATGTVNPLSVTVSTNKSITAGFVENVPPVVTIASPASGNASGSQTFLAGTVSDNVGVISARWLRDGQPVGGLALSNGTFRVDSLTLARGTNVFRVIAADAAGNEGSAQATVVYAPPRVLAVVNPAARQEGLEVTVPIELTSPGDVAGMSFVLYYDAAYLKNPELKWSSAVASALATVNTSAAGEVRTVFTLSNSKTVDAGTTEMAQVTFQSRSVPTNLTAALTLEVSDMSDALGNPIAAADVGNGGAAITVRSIRGDNNANNRLDTGDATIIQRMLAGLDPVRSWDVTGNDLNTSTTLDSGDVIKVMRAVVKLDSQPNPPGNPGKSVKPKALAAVVSPVELAVVSPNGLRGQSGESVTVQLLISNVRTQLAGAEFTLDYPTNALRLVNSSSHQPGSLVSGDTFTLWNVLPAQTDYVAQSGRVIAGLSSGTGWPAATNGTLAQFTFQVQPGAAAQYRWPLVLSGVRLTTANGYSERPVGDAQMYFIGRNAIPANLGSAGGKPQLSGGGFNFGIGGEVGLPYLIEVSTNLSNWVPLQTVTNLTGTLPFNDPGATNATQRYYRARQLE